MTKQSDVEIFDPQTLRVLAARLRAAVNEVNDLSAELARYGVEVSFLSRPDPESLNEGEIESYRVSDLEFRLVLTPMETEAAE